VRSVFDKRLYGLGAGLGLEPLVTPYLVTILRSQSYGELINMLASHFWGKDQEAKAEEEEEEDVFVWLDIVSINQHPYEGGDGAVQGDTIENLEKVTLFGRSGIAPACSSPLNNYLAHCHSSSSSRTQGDQRDGDDVVLSGRTLPVTREDLVYL
jgi:hypothetical protein